jgi:glutamate-1-semialdehyde 2,1-aminomutase
VNTEQSQRWFERALRVLPGGVNSPVRAFGGVGGIPRVIASARGAYLSDVDGNEYLDFVGSWGPLILGHAHPAVVERISAAASSGTSFGAPCRAEIELAERIVAMYPHIEQARCVSSGTEAVMSAIRLARGYTGRDLIVKFSGCYHGHADHLLVSAGSGLVTLGNPSSAGVPDKFTELTRVLPLDDQAAVSELFAREGGDIAAVIVEPVPANNGLLLQDPGFLEHLRYLCDEAGALLILDEVISGFRLGPGGAAERYGVRPDIATFGKVIGGGMPVGAFGSTREIMRRLSPEGDVYQAGTLSGNPVAMSAGLASLDVLEKENGWQKLEALGSYLDERIGPVVAGADIPACLIRIGSIFWIALLTRTAPRSAEALHEQTGAAYAPLFHHALTHNVALAPSAFEVGFLSLAHERGDIDTLANALEGGFAVAAAALDR